MIILTIGISKQLPHSSSVIIWSLSASHLFKNGAMQCSKYISGALIGKSSCLDTALKFINIKKKKLGIIIIGKPQIQVNLLHFV